MTVALRILHAISSDRFAGVEQFVRRLATRQAQNGHKVTVLGGAAEHMRGALANAGVSWHPAPSPYSLFWTARKFLSRSDIVNTHMTAADATVVAASATRPGRTAIVATRHFAQPRGSLGPGIAYRMVERRIDEEIAVSRTVAGAIGVPSTVVYPGIDPVPQRDRPIRKKTVLVAQRLQAEKHTHVAVRAFAASRIADHGWNLEIAGTGPELSPLRTLAKALDIEAAVSFLGFRSDLDQLMNEAGLLLAPAPREHFGLTVLEAMASGLPIVAADAGGHSEMLHGLDARALFIPDDVSASARSLAAMAHDAQAREALGAAERLRQSEEFTINRQTTQTDAVYREAVSKRAAR